MQNLVPFKNVNSSLKLRAEVQRSNTKMTLIFEVLDAEKKIDLPNAFQISTLQIPREDGLWKETCFEMFLRPEGQKKYYEFNFSLKPAWNEYVFSDYRSPQPPKTSDDISLTQMQWDGQQLRIDLSGFSISEKFEISLTAVLKEKSGVQHYLALTHAGEKPDFHLGSSFILKK